MGGTVEDLVVLSRVHFEWISLLFHGFRLIWMSMFMQHDFHLCLVLMWPLAFNCFKQRYGQLVVIIDSSSVIRSMIFEWQSASCLYRHVGIFCVVGSFNKSSDYNSWTMEAELLFVEYSPLMQWGNSSSVCLRYCMCVTPSPYSSYLIPLISVIGLAVLSA